MNYVSEARKNCTSETTSVNTRKNHVGTKVIGRRSGSKSNGFRGVIVDVYATVNHWGHGYWAKTYKNTAYVVRNAEGKELVFQMVEHI
jgi:hypothetical protein